jgi:hypothetical protein
VDGVAYLLQDPRRTSKWRENKDEQTILLTSKAELYFRKQFLIYIFSVWGHAVAYLVEARWPWGRRRNKYQKSSWGVKGSRRVGLTTLPPSVSRLSRQNVGASTSHNPMGPHGLLQG